MRLALSALAALAFGAFGELSSAAAAGCPELPSSQHFAPWGDDDHYAEVPGGDFEAGAPEWARTGAQVVAGNESFFVLGAADAQALRLPAKAKAVSPQFCVTADHPTLRVFARQLNGTGGKLKIEILYPHGGNTMVKKAGLFENKGAYSSWYPSAALPLALELPSSFITAGGGNVRLRIAPDSGTWLVDDVLYDPWKRG